MDLRRAGSRLGIRLNRPEVRNAFDERMIAELTSLFEEVAKDDSLRCVILRGEGAAFCAGADISWMRRAADYGRDDNVADARRLARLFQAFVEVPCPTVAVVQGAALGGGAGLVACADIAVAADDAKLGFTEVRLGIVPAVISPFVLRKVPDCHARRYFATGEVFDGRRASEIGLVSESVPAHQLDARVQQIIAKILTGGPRATRVAKGLVDTIRQTPSDQVFGVTADLIAELRATDEAREGLSAFLEKRHPVWREEE
ncbi:MAG: enoyl-CoA hydratase [Planctomycetes bacterium]|nr:enoyl-CoA hydratase [Planctomycetota bacterium]